VQTASRRRASGSCCKAHGFANSRCGGRVGRGLKRYDNRSSTHRNAKCFGCPGRNAPRRRHRSFERPIRLDEGPIIEQDVARASHKDSVEDLVRKGRDLEKVVLARAVRLYLDDRVLVYGNKTVVFD